MKKVFSACLALVLVALVFSACGAQEEIRVLNFGEYIADGKDGLMDVRKEFRKQTGIRVRYDTVDTNEKLYSTLMGKKSYDVIVASDYMLARLLGEGMLQKLDYDKIPNFKNIMDEYKNPYFDENQEYTVPYFVGYTGLVYNHKLIFNGNPDEEVPDGWEALWDVRNKDERGRGRGLMFDNPRDAFAVAQGLLGYSFNSVNVAQWEAVAEKIKEQKDVRYGFVVDEIFDIMEKNEAWIATCYPGDYLIMRENNKDLRFVYPKETVNFFVDSFAVLKNAQNVDAAHKFIDFMTNGEIALENAEYVGYASPNILVVENEEYTWYKNDVLYPAKAPEHEVFEDLPQEIRELIVRLWDDVKK